MEYNTTELHCSKIQILNKQVLLYNTVTTIYNNNDKPHVYKT